MIECLQENKAYVTEGKRRRYRKGPAFLKRVVAFPDAAIIRRQAAVLSEFMSGEELTLRIASIYRMTPEEAGRLLTQVDENERAELEALRERLNRRINRHAEWNMRGRGKRGF